MVPEKNGGSNGCITCYQEHIEPAEQAREHVIVYTTYVNGKILTWRTVLFLVVSIKGIFVTFADARTNSHALLSIDSGHGKKKRRWQRPFCDCHEMPSCFSTTALPSCESLSPSLRSCEEEIPPVQNITFVGNC